MSDKRIQDAATSASTEHIISELRGVEKLLDQKTPKWGTGYEAVIVGIAAAKLEALQRQQEQQEPLTCKGCMAYTGVPMVSKERCNTCTRSSKHTDLFEPKGERDEG